MNTIRYFLRALFRRNRLEADMAEEMEMHIASQVEANLAAGMPPEKARYAAHRQFGRLESIKETCRQQRFTHGLETFLRDLRIGTRWLRKSPGFTAVATLSLALGIGSCTAIFSLVNAILLRSLPVPNPQELRVIHWSGSDARMRSISGFFKTEGNRSTAECVSPGVFTALRERGAPMADIFAFAPVQDAILRGQREAFTAVGSVVSDNFFTALGARPWIGRAFTPEDNEASAGRDVVITHDLWGKEFDYDPGTIGRTLTVNGHSLTVRGVLGQGFSGVHPGVAHDFYVLMTPQSPFLQRAVSSTEHWWVRLMARVRQGTTDTALQAALDTAFVPEALLQMKEPRILLRPGGGGLAFDRQAYGKPLLLMLAVVGLVLLIACANIAGLSLARGAARQHEFAVCAALGAARGRLIRQSLAETLLLAVLGGGLGILFALWGRTAISRLLAPSTEGLHYDLSLDLRVLSFSLAVALVTAFLAGLLPALRAGRADPLAGLKARATLGTPRLRLGKVLVVAQISLSLVLVTGATLYLRSLLNLKQINAGFNTENLLVFQLNAGFAGYKESELASYYDRVQTGLSALPGVRGAALSVFPLLDNKSSSGGFRFVNRSFDSPQDPMTYRLVVGQTFFETLGVPILEGRSLSPADTAESSKVIVVNQSFAKKYFSDQDALGHTINTWRTDWRIIGVCGDTKYENIVEPVPPTIYISSRQFPLRYGGYFVVRTTQEPLAIAGAVRQAVAKIDPAVPIAHLTTQERLINATISKERLFATLCTALAGFALLLACIGLFGLMSFNVARRSSEIGIRMAIGARRVDIARSILGETLVLAIIGIALGLPAVLAVGRLIQSQLYAVPSNDPMTLLVMSLTLIVVALCAAFLPALRAARVNPIIATRSE